MRPEEVRDTQVDVEAETANRVVELKKQLERVKSMDFFKFVLNPQSFGQTVENIFHTSFLIKDGQAQVRNENGVPMLGMLRFVIFILRWLPTFVFLFRARTTSCRARL